MRISWQKNAIYTKMQTITNKLKANRILISDLRIFNWTVTFFPLFVCFQSDCTVLNRLLFVTVHFGWFDLVKATPRHKMMVVWRWWQLKRQQWRRRRRRWRRCWRRKTIETTEHFTQSFVADRSIAQMHKAAPQKFIKFFAYSFEYYTQRFRFYFIPIRDTLLFFFDFAKL